MTEPFQRQTNLPLTIVVAMSSNRVIGRGNALPWRLSDDLKWFKKNTLGKPVIMGRKTFESIGKALPERDNIVITRNVQFQHDEVTVSHDLEDAVAIAEAFALERQAREICIIGGGEIYRQALPLVQRLYVTEVAAEIEGDTFFPSLNREEWDEEIAGSITKNEKNTYDAILKILTRKQQP